MSVPDESRKQPDAAIVVKFADGDVGKLEAAIKMSELPSEE